MSLEINFLRKKKQVFYNFAFFVLLLHNFIKEWPHSTLLVFNEGAIKHILGAKVWLYGFQSIFWQV